MSHDFCQQISWKIAKVNVGQNFTSLQGAEGM